MDNEKSFIALIEKSIKKNWDLDALTDYRGVTLQYKDVARKIEKLHILFEECGVKPGDKMMLIPGHCCSTVNLHDKIYLFEGDTVVGRIPVTARGIGR